MAIVKPPDKVEWPFGYTVLVYEKEPGDPELEDRWACWDTDNRTICIDSSLKVAEQRGAFLHEMDHAYTDWKAWVVQRWPVKFPEQAEEEPEEESAANGGSNV